MSRKLALIIGNSEYEDADLARLLAPDADVNSLAEVLRDPLIGAFDQVAALVNQPATAIRRAISAFFAEPARDDLLLLYFSGHGIRDDRGQLFLAVKDTEHKLLRGTAIPAAYITEEMDNSRSRRQVLILDCCHSGAFSHGTKAAPGASVGTAATFEGTGSGRVVLTATDSTQYAWEGDRVIGRAENSVFTHYLIHGLRTGEADTDADGHISLDELYNYVYDQVVNETPLQTPGKWSYGQQGEIIIASNTHPVRKPVDLPSDLQETIADSRPWVREGAVRELDRLLRISPAGLTLAVQEALKRLAEDDSRRVASLAADSLAAYAAQQLPHPEATAEPPTEQSKSLEEEHPSTAKVEALPNLAEKTIPEPQPRERAEPPEQPLQSKIEQPAPVLNPAKPPEMMKGTGVLTIILALAVGEGFAWVASAPLGWYGDTFNIMWKTTWALIGLVAALALRRAVPSLSWAHVLIISFGWLLGDIIGSYYDQPLLGSIRGAILGLTTGLVLLMAKPSTSLLQIFMITLGWTLAMFIGDVLGGYIYDPFKSVVTGYIGLWIIPGAFTGAVVGAVGSIIMFWQLGSETRQS